MKDFTKKMLMDKRPTVSSKDAINFCLNAIFEDNQFNICDKVCSGLIFEELIGALLLANDSLKDPNNDN